MPISDWLDLMNDSVTVAPFVSRDSYGKPTYGTPVTYRARVNYKTQFVRVSTSEEAVARGTAIIATVTPMTVNDQVTLPDGSAPLILTLNVETDEAGPLYTKLAFS